MTSIQQQVDEILPCWTDCGNGYKCTCGTETQRKKVLSLIVDAQVSELEKAAEELATSKVSTIGQIINNRIAELNKSKEG